MQVLSCTLPAAALLITPSRCGILAKAAAGLGAAAIVPCVVFAALRRAMKKYVTQSIEGGDLSSIETFYSAAGAGQGSAFWVAELLGQEPALTAPDSVTLLSPRTPRASSMSSAAPQAISKSDSADQLGLPPTAPEPSAAASTGQLTGAADADDPSSPSAITDSAGGDGNGKDTASAEKPDDLRIRDLVHGLVAAAVARLEGAASDSPRQKSPPAPEPQGEKPLAPAPSGGGVKDAAVTIATTPGSGAVQAAAAAAAATPAPGTPSSTVQRPNTFTDPPPPPPPPALASAPSATAAPPRRGTIIGHVALERKSWKQAELRRMSVLQQYSGRGVGGLLLDTLVSHARDVGFRELILYTSGMQGPARRLYGRGGWRETKVADMQGVQVYEYTLDLTKRR